jgi:hypothetical protein
MPHTRAAYFGGLGTCSPNAIAPIAPALLAGPTLDHAEVMPCWILAPIDHRCEIWKTYPVQRLVVEASAEWEAREKVAAAAPDVLLPNPWLDPALTSCERVGEG